MNKRKHNGDEARWKAVEARNEDADGQFWFSVTTTGIYCYPSCPARRPKRENVRFFDTRAAAESAGFRACKRCRSDLKPRRIRHAEAVAQACRTIEQSEHPLTLRELAEEASLSPFHFQRLFKEIVGVTPKQYAMADRTQRLRRQLPKSRSVTDAVYDAGYSSSGHFYERSEAMLGMSPTAFAKGGLGEVIRWDVTECSLGLVLVAATARGICATFLGSDRKKLVRDLRASFPNAAFEQAERGSDFNRWVEQVLTLIETPDGKLKLPLDVSGTAFQYQVWDALRRIPPGRTSSYADVAEQIGRPKAVRAVASAIAANPVAVVIPCHRVIGSDGRLRGYRWGVDRKRALLERESKP